eukprot:6724534-Prymnesium_polylepis.1
MPCVLSRHAVCPRVPRSRHAVACALSFSRPVDLAALGWRVAPAGPCALARVCRLLSRAPRPQLQLHRAR